MLLNPQLYWEMRTILQLYTADEERAVHMQKRHNTLQIQLLEHAGRLYTHTCKHNLKRSKYNNQKTQ